MADLTTFEKDLRTEHAALTEAFEKAQVAASAAKEEAAAHKKALTTFRNKYGRVMKALEEGAIAVEG